MLPHNCLMPSCFSMLASCGPIGGSDLAFAKNPELLQQLRLNITLKICRCTAAMMDRAILTCKYLLPSPLLCVHQMMCLTAWHSSCWQGKGPSNLRLMPSSFVCCALGMQPCVPTCATCHIVPTCTTSYTSLGDDQTGTAATNKSWHVLQKCFLEHITATAKASRLH